MLELIKKENFSEKELIELDTYLSEHIEEAVSFEVEEISRIINLIIESQGYSMFKEELEHYFFEQFFDMKHFFDESKLSYYIKCSKLIKKLDLEDVGYGYVLGDYFYEHDEKEADNIIDCSNYCFGSCFCYRSFGEGEGHTPRYDNSHRISD